MTNKRLAIPLLTLQSAIPGFNELSGEAVARS